MSTERRDIPRFKAILDVQLQGLRVSTNNICISGAQVSCPSMNFEFLSPELASEAINATVMLPGDKRIQCVCLTEYVTDYGDEYLIGLKFTEFEGNGKELLTEYLLQYGGAEFV